LESGIERLNSRSAAASSGSTKNIPIENVVVGRRKRLRENNNRNDDKNESDERLKEHHVGF
jgi:hypothetical protein